MFLLPFTIGWIDLKYSAAFICVIATLAAIQERRLIRAGKDADAHDAGTNLAMRRRNMTD